MATRTTPPGWKLTYEGGKRRAINPSGENVSYGQYLNAQARRSGFKSHSDYRKQAARIGGYRTKENASKLSLGSKELKEFKRTVLDRKRTTARDKSPHSRLARLLEDLGLRPQDAEFPVGDTPGE